MEESDLYEYLKDEKFMKLLCFCCSYVTDEKELDVNYIKENIDTIYKSAKEDPRKWVKICSIYCMKELMFDKK